MSTHNILTNLFENLNHGSNKSAELVNLNRAKNYISRHESDTPIRPDKGGWNQHFIEDYTCILKKYYIKNDDNLAYFVLEIIKLSNKINHHPVITIDHLDVTVKLFTKDFNDVTDIDLSMSKMIDEIYDDISFIEKL